MTPVEEWRPTHHPDYEVSDLGRVRSVKTGKARKVSRHVVTGYLHLRLADREPGKATNHYVHRLVAVAFFGPCPDGQEVRHKNDVRWDCRATNLEYGTRSQNHVDAVLRRRNRRTKLTMEQVGRVRILAAQGRSASSVASALGLPRAAVVHAVARRSWAHVA